MQQDNIEYLSGEVKEILSSPPSWVSTWGVSVLVSTVGLIALVGFLFHYPEVVSGNVTISTETPAVQVVAPSDGVIAQIRITDSTEVSLGDPMLSFPSTAVYEDVLRLEKDMENIGQLDLEKLRSYSPNRDLKTGELDAAYSNFITAFELVPLTESGDIDYETVSAVELMNTQSQRQLRSEVATQSSVKNELAALQKELRNATSQYAQTIDTNEMLVILSIQSKIKNKEAEIDRIASKIQGIKGEMSKANVRRLQAQTQAQAGAGEAISKLNLRLEELKKAIVAWKERHILYATSSGAVQFYSNIKEGDSVKFGEVLFTIMPKTISNNYVGRINLPVAKSSKVKAGQVVNIKFERYNFRENGSVRAKVSKVYPVAKDNAFYADIVIENGLVTTLNRKLDYYQQMNGKAEIITDDRTFISKLFEKFTTVWQD